MMLTGSSLTTFVQPLLVWRVKIECLNAEIEAPFDALTDQGRANALPTKALRNEYLTKPMLLIVVSRKFKAFDARSP